MASQFGNWSLNNLLAGFFSGVISDPWFYAVAIPAVFLTGFSKSGAVSGLGMLAVPIMAMAVSPVQAAGIMLPVLCMMDLLGIRAYRKHLNWEIFRSLIPGAFFGILLGYWLFKVVPAKWVLIVLGIECTAFALYRMIQQRALAAAQAQKPSFLRASFFSTVGGFASTIAHAGSPPIIQYVLPLKLPKLQHVAITVCFFTMANYVKIIPYAFLGLINTQNLATALVLLPIVPLAYWVGVKAVHKMPERFFFHLLTWSLFFMGLRLMYQGFAMP